ncbi:MAG: 5'/3'-nucleotidase SurE [Microscillaceae bacterium]|nr:5'/3'-nucleotidase SurE [Microscillaceae bacterium]MDW8459897.1 5'/3'-nucleotidase SurE [Cytophagales bacterium]
MQTKNKPLILVSNDDGITAKGIATLVEIMQEIGEVVVVAPDKPQSGMGHAITVGNTLHLHESPIFGKEVLAYECSGTPADCIKLAKHYVLKERKPDLVVSGINHGANTSISVLYSGTMSAAIEGAVEGFPAIGFSLADYSSQADFSHCYYYVKKIALKALEEGIPKGVALNVNIPKKSEEQIKGIKVCRQAKARWIEEFDQRVDPRGRTYFWLTGEFLNEEPRATDTDEFVLSENYISIVPCQYDLTAYYALSQINAWKFEV